MNTLLAFGHFHWGHGFGDAGFGAVLVFFLFLALLVVAGKVAEK